MKTALLIASARRLARTSVRSANAIAASTARASSAHVAAVVPRAVVARQSPAIAIRAFATKGPGGDDSGSDSDSDAEGRDDSDDSDDDEEEEGDDEDDDDDDDEEEEDEGLDAYLAAQREAFTPKELRKFEEEQNANYWDEERWGKLDSEDWQGFTGDLDAVTEEGVPTWLQSVRDLSAINEENRMRAKLARRAMEEAKKNVLRVRKVDEQGRAYGTGRRKTSTARVWIKPSATPFDGTVKINKKDLVDYFVRDTHREDVLRPFVVVGQVGNFDVYATVKGGGLTGQAGAVRHGLSRALQHFDPKLRAALKKEKLLTRDPRSVERKKAGQKKARKKFQWVKR